MNEFIQIFIDFIPNDKDFVVDLIPKYENEFKLLGKFIKQHRTLLKCKDNEFMEELFDFLDGNGFEVVRPRVKNPYDTHPIELIPIYVEKTTFEEEIEKVNEKLKTAIKKIQSAVSEYVPVQETALSYTSMEDSEGYILEYSQLSTPRPIWICLRRYLEFLRLVPEGRCRSTPVPRPP